MRAISLLFHDVYLSDPLESGFGSDAANRYKLSVADFDAQLDGVAAVRPDAPVVATDLIGGSAARPIAPPRNPPYGSVQGPPYADPQFLITVDDGGVSYHSVIADRLEQRGWRGHCFVSTDLIGQRGFLSAAQIRELDARGHVIGSHSASHPARFSAQPFDAMVGEWSRSRAVLEDVLGHPIDIASVPGGYFSPAVARAACDAGIRLLFTSEPVTTVQSGPDCTLIGRFTIRHGDPSDAAQRFVVSTPWARSSAWVSWNAKGLVKPLLGPSYMRIADWLFAMRRPAEPRNPWAHS
jgi:peptidoglycan/xylan/chitin deacetylase (PgdA/CDA1 family)